MPSSTVPVPRGSGHHRSRRMQRWGWLPRGRPGPAQEPLSPDNGPKIWTRLAACHSAPEPGISQADPRSCLQLPRVIHQETGLSASPQASDGIGNGVGAGRTREQPGVPSSGADGPWRSCLPRASLRGRCGENSTIPHGVVIPGGGRSRSNTAAAMVRELDDSD